MKRRNPLAVFLLSIITFGIYDIYWLVVTKKELNAKTRTKVPTIWLLFAPIVLMIAAVIVLVAVGGTHTANPDTTAMFSPNTGAARPLSPAAGIGFIVVWLLSLLVIMPITFYWFLKFSKAVNEYTSGKMSTGVTFLLMWLLHLLGVALVQDAFNDMLDAGGGAPAVAAAQPQPIAPITAAEPQGFVTPGVQPAAPAPTPPAAPQSDSAPTTPEQPAESPQPPVMPPTDPTAVG